MIPCACPVSALAQDNFKCPDDYGFYPHSHSCDKYYKCDGGVADLKTCGNGLAFDATDSKFLTENCDYLHNVDCSDRPGLGKRALVEARSPIARSWTRERHTTSSKPLALVT
jgi:hypothetical protein